MTDSATQPGVGDAKGKRTIDWEAIEREYRAGVLSVREIAKRYGCDDKSIRKRAKGNPGKGIPPWDRDLTTQVQKKVRTALVRIEARAGPRTAEDVRTEREIVDEAAATVVDVVRSHRKDVRKAHAVVGTLLLQLVDAADYRETLRDYVEDHADARLADGAHPGSVAQERALMMRMVALPSHAATARDLATAMTKLVALERQAFNIDQTPDPDPPDAGPQTLDEADPSLASLLMKLTQITGKPIEPAATSDEPPKA